VSVASCSAEIEGLNGDVGDVANVDSRGEDVQTGDVLKDEFDFVILVLGPTIVATHSASKT
jgi:hypothetical protein